MIPLPLPLLFVLLHRAAAQALRQRPFATQVPPLVEKDWRKAVCQASVADGELFA
jgi:hypothetical protein